MGQNTQDSKEYWKLVSIIIILAIYISLVFTITPTTLINFQ